MLLTAVAAAALAGLPEATRIQTWLGARGPGSLDAWSSVQAPSPGRGGDRSLSSSLRRPSGSWLRFLSGCGVSGWKRPLLLRKPGGGVFVDSTVGPLWSGVPPTYSTLSKSLLCV